MTNNIKDEELLKLLSLDVGSKERQLILGRLADLPNEEFKNNFIFVYGSLRKDHYNYQKIRNMFGKNSLIYITDQKIEYAKLYDLGSYPAIIRAGYNDRVVGEIMYCSNEVYKAIEEMELGSGYIKDNTNIFIRTYYGSLRCTWITYYSAGIELTKSIKNNVVKYPLVTSGDWSDYLLGVEEKV